MRDRRERLQKYLDSQGQTVHDAEAGSGARVSFYNSPAGSLDEKGMKFKWRFTDGERQSENALIGEFSWSPLEPNDICVSGSNIEDGYIPLDDFTATEMVDHICNVMSEVLVANARKRYPHIR